MINVNYTEEKNIDNNSLLNIYNDADWSVYTKDLNNLKNAITNSLFVLTARVDGELAGLLRVVGDGLTIIYIQDILVLKKYKRQNIGTSLINQTLEKYINVRQKVLLTDDTKETRGFYESLGFESCDKETLVSFIKK